MDNFILGMLAGIFIGTVIGMFMVSCLVVGRDEHDEYTEDEEDK